jgi:hypothetical protein
MMSVEGLFVVQISGLMEKGSERETPLSFERGWLTRAIKGMNMIYEKGGEIMYNSLVNRKAFVKGLVLLLAATLIVPILMASQAEAVKPEGELRIAVSSMEK